MRSCFIVLIVVALLCSLGAIDTQPQTPSTAPSLNSVQAATALQSSISALAARSSLTDITLTGNAEWIAGSDDEKGSVTFRALRSASRLDMTFSSGTRTEIRYTDSSRTLGLWIGPDGVSHSMADHNLLVDSGLFPLFALSNLSSSPNAVLAYFGPEPRNGASVIHLSASQQSAGAQPAETALQQRLTQVDIYLDSATFLPVSYVFNIHPDDNALLDIPAEIRYSNYQAIGGALIPLHVQRFVNNTLTLDLQFQNASPNTGITAAQIAAQ